MSKTITKSSITKHKPAGLTRQRVPPPQRERILQKYVAGTSIVQISREEKRNRETVTRIVRSSDMQGFVIAMRERLYALAGDALVAVQHTLQTEKDGRLGLQLLTGLGVIASPEEKYEMAKRHAARLEKGENEGQKRVLAQVIDLFCKRTQMYDSHVPKFEEDLAKAGGRLNYVTGKIEPLQ